MQRLRGVAAALVRAAASKPAILPLAVESAALRAPASATQAARSNAAFSTLINVVRARAVAGRASLGQQKVD